MISRKKKYKKDLEKLIKKGKQLFCAIHKDHCPEGYEQWSESDIKKIPNFYTEYQNWYTESLIVIKQLIPDRKDDFVKLYKTPKNRKKINEENYSIEDYLTGAERHSGPEKIRLLVHSIGFKKKKLDPLIKDIITGETSFRAKTIILFQQQLAILESAQQTFDSSLFDIKQKKSIKKQFLPYLENFLQIIKPIWDWIQKLTLI